MAEKDKNVIEGGGGEDSNPFTWQLRREDQLRNDPMLNTRTYLSEYKPGWRDRLVNWISGDAPVSPALNSVFGSNGLGNPSGYPEMSLSELTAIPSIIDAGEAAKEGNYGEAALTAGFGFALPYGLGRVAKRMMRAPDLAARYPNLAHEIAEEMPGYRNFGLREMQKRHPQHLEKFDNAALNRYTLDHRLARGDRLSEIDNVLSREMPSPPPGGLSKTEMLPWQNYADGPQVSVSRGHMQKNPHEIDYITEKMMDMPSSEIVNPITPGGYNLGPTSTVQKFTGPNSPNVDYLKILKDMPMTGKPHAAGGAVDGTPEMFAQKEAAGQIHVGPIPSAIPGRTDKLPMSVKAGSFVFPADIVSALGEGNTAAGNEAIKQLLGVPRGGMIPPSLAKMLAKVKTPKRRLPKLYAPGSKRRAFAGGGTVPIIAAGGEYIAAPEEVAAFGEGDLEYGHEILNTITQAIRKNTIDTLKALPPPAK